MGVACLHGHVAQSSAHRAARRRCPKGALERAHRRDEVVANIAALVRKARQERVPVIWVQHSDEDLARGSDPWRLVAELDRDEAEPLIEKSYGDAFEDTALESALSDLGVGRLIVVGAQTDACIRCTLHGALTRGYDAILVSDAHTTEDQTQWGAPTPEQVIAHTSPGPRRRNQRNQGCRVRAGELSQTPASSPKRVWSRRCRSRCPPGRSGTQIARAAKFDATGRS
jgi:Isochorismatase family